MCFQPAAGLVCQPARPIPVRDLSRCAVIPGRGLSPGAVGEATGLRRERHSAGIAVWQWAHVVGGSTSARVPHEGHTRRSQQTASPGLSSAAAGTPAERSFVYRTSASGSGVIGVPGAAIVGAGQPDDRDSPVGLLLVSRVARLTLSDLLPRLRPSVSGELSRRYLQVVAAEFDPDLIRMRGDVVVPSRVMS